MKEFAPKPYLFPMPTYMIGTYNDDESVDVMMMAWGGICGEDLVALNLDPEHRTSLNIEMRKAFTLAVPSIDTIRESDYLGIASSNTVKDKFERTDLHAERSKKVDAPVILEYPVTLECELVEIKDNDLEYRILGRIVGMLADEKVLDEKGNIDIEKVRPFVFDQAKYGYYELGRKVGQAWKSGVELVKKK